MSDYAEFARARSSPIKASSGIEAHDALHVEYDFNWPISCGRFGGHTIKIALMFDKRVNHFITRLSKNGFAAGSMRMLKDCS